MCNYYVYRFKDENKNIIYVGKTKDIKMRMNQHFIHDGHLGEEAYSNVDKIEYMEFDSKVEMDIRELYYINKWNPKYNKMNRRDDEVFDLELEGKEWSEFTLDNTAMNYLQFKLYNLKKKLSKKEILKSFTQKEGEHYLISSCQNELAELLIQPINNTFDLNLKMFYMDIRNLIDKYEIRDIFEKYNNVCLEVEEYVKNQELIEPNKIYYNDVIFTYILVEVLAIKWTESFKRLSKSDKWDTSKVRHKSNLEFSSEFYQSLMTIIKFKNNALDVETIVSSFITKNVEVFTMAFIYAHQLKVNFSDNEAITLVSETLNAFKNKHDKVAS